MGNEIIKQLAYSRKQLAEKLNYSSEIRKEAEADVSKSTFLLVRSFFQCFAIIDQQSFPR